MGQGPTGQVLLAWYLAVSSGGSEHTWRELSSMLRYPGKWTSVRFRLISLLSCALSERTYCANSFDYDYGSEWTIASISGCFCRALDYVKLRTMLCDASDLYVVGVLVETRARMTEMVCLSLGSFAQDAGGVSRALATKETLRLMQYIGLMPSARMIVYLDNHGHTTIAILAEQAEVRAVQRGLLVQLDAQQHIGHLYNSVVVMVDLFERPASFGYDDWRVLGAFAILVARCCDHSGELLLRRPICNLAAVPPAWASHGAAVVEALRVVISASSYTKDTIQLCANMLLELDEHGKLPSRPPPAGPACSAPSLRGFFDELSETVFGPRTTRAEHSCGTRWASLVSSTTAVDVPTGSEHVYIWCALTADMPLAELKEAVSQVSKFLELDRKVDTWLEAQSIRSIEHTPVPFDQYDVDALFECLNLRRLYPDVVETSDGGWRTMVPASKRQRCLGATQSGSFQSFKF